MFTKIFVNLPVKDLKNSMQFYQALGYKHNPQFTDDTASCIVISDTIFVMLLTHDKFKELIPKHISVESKVCHALSCDSREAVDTMVAKAIASGGLKSQEPEDNGFMYQHGFVDLDGHGWGLFWMNPTAQ